MFTHFTLPHILWHKPETSSTVSFRRPLGFPEHELDEPSEDEEADSDEASSQEPEEEFQSNSSEGDYLHEHEEEEGEEQQLSSDQQQPGQEQQEQPAVTGSHRGVNRAPAAAPYI